MNLEIAVERLYETGWIPSVEQDLRRLPDGRSYPSPQSIQVEFTRAGLTLAIKHNLIFGCHRATWDPGSLPGGTVVGSCEEEAAVFALAQLRSAQLEQTVNS